MITIKGRQMLIPPKERYIGTTYDENSEQRTFLIDRVATNGVDLSALTFRLDLEYENGNKDTALLEKEVQEDSIVLIWNITNSVLQVPGTVFIDIRATDTQGTVKWASFRAAVYVDTTINTPGSYTGKLTELEQAEARIDTKIENLDAAEEQRKQNELARITSETLRQQEETERQANEARRQQAEQERDERVEKVINTFDSAIQDAKDAAELAEAWAHGHEDYPENQTDNSMYWAGRSKDYSSQAKNEADRAAMYADYIEPDFILADNRIYVNANSTVDFVLESNRIYFKLPG